MSKRKRSTKVTSEAEQSRKISTFFIPQKRPRIEEPERQEKLSPVAVDHQNEENQDLDDFTQPDDDDEGLFDFFSGRVGVESSQNLPESQSQSSSWLWEPLTEVHHIRVLTIESSKSQEEPLRCNFRTTSLQDPCDYFALSYCWGQTHENGSHLTHSIVCNDHLFKITSNLHEALLRLRKLHSDAAKRSSRYKLHIPAIWIDAVCIDQGNPVERSRQIMMMDKIYQNAQHLLVWLGGHYSSEPIIHEDEMRSFLSPDPLDSVIRSDINSRLRQRAFFGRRWVVQEVYLCGNRHSILIGDFIFSSSNLKEVLKDPQSTAIAHSHIVRSGTSSSSSQESKPSLFHNLSRYESFSCSDDRDKIYALRSISSDGSALPIDYRLPTAKVFLNLAIRWLQAGHLIPTFVSAVTRPPRHNTNTNTLTLPSWAPNWQIASSTKTIIDFSQRNQPGPRRQDTQLLSDQLYTNAKLTAKNEQLPADSYAIENEPSLTEEEQTRVRLTGWIINRCACASNPSEDTCAWCFFLPHVKQSFGINANLYTYVKAHESNKPAMLVMENFWQEKFRLLVLENGWILLLSSEEAKEATFTLRGVLETQRLIFADDEWTSKRLLCSLPQRPMETIYLR